MTFPTALNDLPRHRRAIESVIGRFQGRDDLVGLLLVGSFAAGNTDAVSDVDLIALVGDGRFEQAWRRRSQLSADAIYRWDFGPNGQAGAHKWLTRDLVLVECLIGEVGAIRVAEPWIQLIGADMGHRLVRREPIPRAEARSGRFSGDDVERLYDAFKLWLRGDRGAARALARDVADGDDLDGAIRPTDDGGDITRD